MKNKPVLIAAMLFVCSFAFASSVTFTGGYTKVSLQDNDHRVMLTEGAKVHTEDVDLDAQTIELYGEDYCFVNCRDEVVVKEKKRGITLTCADLLYDRNTNTLISDGWVEIEDPENEAQLSASWFEYNTDTSVMKLQMKASIKKDTDSGLLSCTADSIEYNADEQTLTLKGSANVNWGSDTYSASMIIVDIDTEDISLHGSISGEVHGD